MAFSGRRRTVPSARWSEVIDVLEEWHVSYGEYLDAPDEMVQEWAVRIQARRTVEYKEHRRREQQASAAAARGKR